MANLKSIIYVIGIGNSQSTLTLEAVEILNKVDVVGGHYGFIDMIRDFLKPEVQLVDDSPARERSKSFIEYQQCRIASCVNEALKGKSVAVVSGGDSGIWGMAGVFLEAQKEHQCDFDVKIIPGVPTMTSIAAKLGAPLLNGFSLIAVNDEDYPFSVIQQRLKGAALGKGVIILFKLILENIEYPDYYPEEKYPELYPPKEKTNYRLNETFNILKEHIPTDRPMMIVTDLNDQTSAYSQKTKMLGSDTGEEEIIHTTFGQFLKYIPKFRFFTSIIIGDEHTVRFNDTYYTPQWHYHWKYDKKMVEKINNLEYLKKA